MHLNLVRAELCLWPENTGGHQRCFICRCCHAQSKRNASNGELCLPDKATSKAGWACQSGVLVSSPSMFLLAADYDNHRMFLHSCIILTGLFCINPSISCFPLCNQFIQASCGYCPGYIILVGFRKNMLGAILRQPTCPILILLLVYFTENRERYKGEQARLSHCSFLCFLPCSLNSLQLVDCFTSVILIYLKAGKQVYAGAPDCCCDP
jgi:hypothetical protein